jgi:periplasmic mercuric ion binding protein
MKKLVFFTFGLFLLAACADKSTNTVEEVAATKEQEVVVNPTNMLTMEISGMTCEMGCGGTIRKGLRASNAVESVKFEDFDADYETNTTHILYDAKKISKEELKKIVNELSNGQYKVESMSDTEYSSENDQASAVSGSSKKSTTLPLIGDGSTGLFSFQLPNLLDLLSIRFF